MRLAYLILVHERPSQLARLVTALDDEGVTFFVHVDRKVPIEGFVRALAGLPNVRFVEPRESVVWGALSVVHAELHLLRAAAAARPSFNRFCLMSGADYPIKSRAHIREVLRGSDRELMGIWCTLTPARDDHYWQVAHYYFGEFALVRAARSPLQKRLASVGLRSVRLVNRVLGPRRWASGPPACKGSTWWCLTAASVRYLLDFVDRNPDYVRFHRRVFAADEILFQSILKASPFADRLSHDGDKGTLVGNDLGSHYVDWALDAPTRPRVLDERDLPALIASSALFARKFDQVHSSRLLDALDARREQPRRVSDISLTE